MGLVAFALHRCYTSVVFAASASRAPTESGSRCRCPGLAGWGPPSPLRGPCRLVALVAACVADRAPGAAWHSIVAASASHSVLGLLMDPNTYDVPAHSRRTALVIGGFGPGRARDGGLAAQASRGQSAASAEPERCGREARGEPAERAAARRGVLALLERAGGSPT